MLIFIQFSCLYGKGKCSNYKKAFELYKKIMLIPNTILHIFEKGKGTKKS